MRDNERADDLVQDTLVRGLDKVHLYRSGDLRAWLFTIMHNQSVNQIRRAIGDNATVDLEACSQSLVATTDPTASRQLRELERALGKLHEDQRQVILLIGLEGMSYEKTARRIQRTVKCLDYAQIYLTLVDRFVDLKALVNGLDKLFKS